MSENRSIHANFKDDLIANTLSTLKKEEEEELVEMLSHKYNLPYVDLRGTVIEPDSLRVISEEEARKAEVAPFKIFNKKVFLLIFSPTNPKTLELIRSLEARGIELEIVMGSHNSLNYIYDRYKDLTNSTKIDNGTLDLSQETLKKIVENISTINDLRQALVEVSDAKRAYRISRIIEMIIAGALHFKASDIHIEPEEDKVRIRFRIDGVLQDICFTDKETMRLMNSRLKLLSGLKLSTVQNAQDGRFSIQADNLEIEVRVSLIPGNYGESFVMRILDPRMIAGELENLGMSKTLYNRVERSIKKPNGIILTTGPTGSGKTTTLYAFIRKIYNPEIKIITIEDPVEYHIEGITQTQVEEEKGYTFLSGLRSVLRQDPDVIMIGEIRDSETAKVAVNAALTGHLVFSTLHTNNAAGTIPRLIELGVNPKILGSALTLSMSQRLVRRLCQYCKKEIEVTDEYNKLITNILGEIVTSGRGELLENIKPRQKYIIYTAIGCDKCHDGYKGRMGIFEAIYMDENIEQLLDQNPSERMIKKAALQQNMLTLKEDAIIKILKGETSIEEVEKVVDLYEA